MTDDKKNGEITEPVEEKKAEIEGEGKGFGKVAGESHRLADL